MRRADVAQRLIDEGTWAIGLAAAYYVSCLVGFALRFPASGISFLWPPNAVLLTGLLISATRRWPALIAGAFVAHGLAHIQDGIPTAAWCVQYFGNSSQALLAAWIVRRFDAVAVHEDLRRLLVFVVGACIVAPAVASITPAYIYVTLGWAKDVFAGWRARAVSNSVATLGLVPSFLAVWHYCVERPAVRARSVLEFCALLLGLIATHFVAGRTNLLGLSVSLSATTPFLIWATVRFGSTGLSFALSAALLLMSTSAPQMAGFAGGIPADAIIGVQLLVMATAVPMFLLAALFKAQRAGDRALGVAENQTEAATRALTEANQRLARVGRTAAMSELTASLAHELNQPLTAISTNVLTCLRGLDPQQQRATVDALMDVLQDTRRASRIVERTQRLFQNRPTQPIPLNLNDVVRDVLRIAAPRLRELQVRVRETLDPAIPNVHADDVQIQQVLLNLLLNAADAVHGLDMSRRVIHISTRRTRRHVILSVGDNGVGLHHADRSRIFEPFYTTKADGLGMGLAVSRSIVRSHGGTLWGVSNRGFGSTFRLKMPVSASVAESGVAGHTRKVLVVDDHPGMRKSLTRLLSSYGYDVAAASSGMRAVAVTRTFQPDAAVIDMSLGDTTGLELATRLRAVPASGSLFLVALTAHDEEHLRQACLAAGFDDYLVKQTQISELPALLQRRAPAAN